MTATSDQAEIPQGDKGTGGEPEVLEAGPERGEFITHPAKLMRIAAMTQAMLNEVRETALDEAGRRRLQEINERILKELSTVLSEDLADELAEMFVPLDAHTPTEGELRIAQAQLVGWLEGLFNGIHAAVISQQMMSQAQLRAMQERKAIEPGKRESSTGQYL